eukprot:760415-Hanusia_phi.AAC.2
MATKRGVGEDEEEREAERSKKRGLRGGEAERSKKRGLRGGEAEETKRGGREEAGTGKERDRRITWGGLFWPNESFICEVKAEEVKGEGSGAERRAEEEEEKRGGGGESDLHLRHPRLPLDVRGVKNAEDGQQRQSHRLQVRLPPAQPQQLTLHCQVPLLATGPQRDER